MAEIKPPEQHEGEERYFNSPGEGVSDDVGQSIGAMPEPDRGLGPNVPEEEKKDSGFFGAGSNAGEQDDNLARETTPGYQADKWDRGTIMPR